MTPAWSKFQATLGLLQCPVSSIRRGMTPPRRAASEAPDYRSIRGIDAHLPHFAVASQDSEPVH